MKTKFLTLTIASLLSTTNLVTAQEASVQSEPQPQAEVPIDALPGYVPANPAARPRGMGTGGENVPAPTTFPMVAPDYPMRSPDGMPEISTGSTITEEKIEGFNESIEQVFPMTPDMIRQYRQIFEENQDAVLERVEPETTSDAGIVSLEPGEEAPTLSLAPGIASVVGFYDASGQPWPVAQYVIGSGDQFQIIQLGKDANSLTVTPLTRVGWTNLVIMLRDEP
ncbi:DotH/IcmK family type IV secretion protein, partial [Marinobacter alexandrii]